jgi:acetyl-CoA synthetase
LSSLARLLFPRSIVFIGGGECDVAIRKTLELGFTGQITAVHPTRETLGGVPCVRSLDELLGVPDAAFIAVKRDLAIDMVHRLKVHGTGGAVVYASGFSETGSEGEKLQQALLAAGKGMPVMGPNCYGFINYLARAALWPDEHGSVPRDSGVAIITQSGNMAVNFTMTRRGLPLAAIVTLGNQADVGISEVLDFLSEDPRITAIGLHIEGLKDPIAFSAAAARARERRKPIVALKTGRSEKGAKVALSHTSSLAGADAFYDALFERHGVARVHSVTAFVETLKFLHHGGPLPGNRVVSMSCSGGEATLIADLAEGRRLTFPGFDPATRSKVAKTLNEYVAVDNPLDYHTFIWNQEDKLRATFGAVLGGGFDVGMLILDVPTIGTMNPETWLVTANAFINAAHDAKARCALVASLPECLLESLTDNLSNAGVAPMAGLDDALTAFEAAADIGRNWAINEPAVPLLPIARRSGQPQTLTESAAKELLSKAGLGIPRSVECTPKDAPACAAKLGFPVVLKVSSAEVTHKTESGGVVLNLASEEEVGAAAVRLGRISPMLLVEKMVDGAVCELIVGVKFDPHFGLALVMGAGGVLTELLKDTTTVLLPARRDDFARALDGLKVARLVKGFRGRSGDYEALLDAIEAVARFAEAHRSSLVELDVNPLLVLSPGQGAVAVDALLSLQEES